MEMKVLCKVLPFFVVFMLLSPSLALAVNCDSNCQYVWKGLFGFDPAWLNEPRQLVINAIIPPLAIFVIFLGMMRAIRLNQFMGNMDVAIALVVMFATLFTGGLAWLNTYVLAAMGQFAFFAFVSMFGVGVVFYWIGYYRERKLQSGLHASYLRDANSLEVRIKKIRENLDKEYINLEHVTLEKPRNAILLRIAQLENKLRKYETDRNELNRSYAAIPPAP